MKDVNGKLAFVTGGVSGIGLGIAKAFLNAGMETVITYLREAQLCEALKELSAVHRSKVHPIQLDVTDRAAVEAVSQEVRRAYGKIHVLCNCAGVNHLGNIDQASYSDWDWILGVNLFGTINCIMSFLPKIKEHGEGGHIINVASMAAFIAGPNAGIYTTSKFAVRGLSESLRYSLARHRIGVSLLCPGLTRTRIHESLLYRPGLQSAPCESADAGAIERMARVHEVGMDPDEVGSKAFRGMLRNMFYVFPHPEFKDEIRAACDWIVSCFPQEPADSRRLEFEETRRAAKRHAEEEIVRLSNRYAMT